VILLGLVGWLAFQNSADDGDGELLPGQAKAQGNGSNATTSKPTPEDNQEPAPLPEDLIETNDAITRSANYSIRVKAPNGTLLNGTLWVIAHTPELDRRISEGVTRAYSLWDSSLFLEDDFLDGLYALSAPTWPGTKEFALQCAVPGYAPQVIPLPSAPGEVEFVMAPVAPIQVHVLDPMGKPLSNAQCWIRAGHDLNGREEFDWITALQQFGFGASVLTNNQGVATFPVCYSEAINTVQAFPESEFAGATVAGLAPGDDETIICSHACTIVGHLINRKTKAPIAGSVTISTLDNNFDISTVLTYAVADDGVFRAERLPANFPALFLEAHSPGFAYGEAQILSAGPNSVSNIEIYLDEGATLDLSLRTAWGDPIPNTEVTLRRKRHGWQSPALFTDGNGQVHFPTILPKGEELAVILGIENNFWLRTPQNLETGKDELVIHDLARIQKVRVSGLEMPDEPAQFSWTALADEIPGEVNWNAQEPSPLLPSGPGFLKMTTKNGMAFQQACVITDGEQNVLDLEFNSAPLTFQWLGSSNAALTITAASGVSVMEAIEISPGPNSIKLWPGTFHVKLSYEAGTRTWNHLTIPLGGLDLGAISGIDDSGIWGAIKDVHDAPATGLLVNLIELGGLARHYGGTDDQGQFLFSGIPPGEYRLSVNGGVTRGGSVPDLDTTVFLGPGEWVGPLELVVDGNELGFMGRVTPNPLTGSSAWMLHQGQIQHQDLPMSLEFLFPVPTEETWFGVSHLGRGSLQISGKRISTKETNSVVHWRPNVHKVQFVDELGDPRTDIFLHAYLNGVALPFQATPDGQGTITLAVTPGLPLTIRAKSSDGITNVWKAETLLQQDKVILPREIDHFLLVVMNGERAPLPLAAAMRAGIGDVVQANGRGELLLPTFDAQFPYLVSAPGYLGVWLSDAQEGELVLKPWLYDLVLDLGEGSAGDSMPFEDAQTVLFTFEDLPHGAEIDSTLKITLEKGRITTLPPLPPGTAEVNLLNGNGDSIATKRFRLHASAQQLKWDA
ncbi:MAG: carboxypeptidase-like regulatory domain-containing protein, partial [Planctomycetota bacterium]|nr:carboxypeptidase-like regulatory domain-containing protein [Planctomycetota bacterium]